MMKYRIAVVDWHTAFGDVVRSPAVQVRVAFSGGLQSPIATQWQRRRHT